jgi:hypothetical protein
MHSARGSETQPGPTARTSCCPEHECLILHFDGSAWLGLREIVRVVTGVALVVE